VTFPLDYVRSRFPGLARDEVFLDNAGGSQILGSVIDGIGDYLRDCNVQHGATYGASQRAAERVTAGKQALASLFGAGPGTVVFGPSTTQIVFNLAAALGPSLQPGDEIVVTEADHEANVGAWRRVAAQRGAEVKLWRIDPARQGLELTDLAPLLGPRTRLVCMTHCSNVLGTIFDVAAAAELVHRAGAKLFVDGVAYAPHGPVDVAALGVDGYVFSIYKVYGPHLAAAYLGPELFAELANINHDFYDCGPYRLQPGGVNYELVAGGAAVATYLDDLGEHLGPGPDPRGRAWTAIAAHEADLAEHLLGFLGSCPKVHVVGDSRPSRAVRVPTISFVVDGVPSPSIPAQVDPHGVGIRFGDFCSRALVDALGLRPHGGVVRVSLVHYNSHAEVERLIAALRPIVA
jgi:cysteine desulfurase family protein (TIGR01976 family)